MLTSSHLCELVFAEGTERTRGELTRRTLRRLVAACLVVRMRGPQGQAGGGSRPSIYALTTRGDRLLSQYRSQPPARARRRPADAGTGLQAHQLAIADLHVALVAAARTHNAPLRWLGEPGCWWEFGGQGGRELLKPDGYAELDLPGATRLAWFEVDRATQSVPTTIAGKVRRYCRAALAKVAAGEPVPLVVFVVGGTARRERIAAQRERWARREGLSATAAHRLVQVVAPADVVPLLLGTEDAP